MSVRDQIAEFCFHLTFEDLPQDVVEFTRLLIMDQIGLTISGPGRHRQAGDTDLSGFFKEMGGKEESSLVGKGCKVPCMNAAFSNTAVSFGGFDGLHRSAIHLPCCLIPAAIAVAERQAASGKDLILATVIGSEIAARMAWALGADSAYNRGFHPTSLCAPFGCAAAAGKLLGLGKEALAEGLSIAAVQAAGVRPWPQVPKAAQTAWIQVGRAAQSGVMAALLAQMGIVGIREIFEHPQGFLTSHSSDPDLKKLTEGLGAAYEVKNTTLKRFGAGIYIIPGIEALLDIMQRHEIRAEDIARMIFKIPTAVVPLVGSPAYPSLRGSSKSSRYVLAVTAYKGEEGMLFNRDYQSESTLNDRRYRELFQLIDVVGDPELDMFFPGKWPCILTVRTKDGREYSRFHDEPVKGEPENPFTPPEIEARFENVVTPVLKQKSCRRLLEILRRLEDVRDVSDLANLIAGS